MAVQKADYIWRDYEVDGVSASGAHKPILREQRQWGTYVENSLLGVTAGATIYDSKADMTADTSQAANAMAWVLGDPIPGNNGIYQFDGTSTWTRLGDLPYSYIKASNAGAGTANAIQATTSAPIPAADGGALIALPIVADNTASPVTISFNGGPALTIKTVSGNDATDLTAGMIAAGYVSGSTFRLLSGTRGWSPVYATVVDSTVTPSRRIRKLVDWIGGDGPKPNDIGKYEGSTGFVTDAADAVDYRGPAGPSGNGSGDMLKSSYDPLDRQEPVLFMSDAGTGSDLSTDPDKLAKREDVGEAIGTLRFIGLGADVTSSFQAALTKAASEGKRLVLSGDILVSSDIVIDGKTDVVGLPGATIEASGANVVKISGAIPDISIEGVAFKGFPRSALWLEEGAQIERLSVRRCKFKDNRVSISAEMDRSIPSYGNDKYHGPNTNTKISRFEWLDNEIDGGAAGVALSCITQRYTVRGGEVKNLNNSDAGGSDLEHAVQGIRIFLDGLSREDDGKYSHFYDEQLGGIVTGVHIHDCRQTIATKGINGIILSGFGVVIANNVIENVYHTQVADPGDNQGNLDDEAIYSKASERVIANNTIRNSGGNQAAINLKGIDISVLNEAAAQGSPPGRGSVVIGNNCYWDDDYPHISAGIDVEASPALIVGNNFQGLTDIGIIVQGEIEPGHTFEDVIISNNRFEGSFNSTIVFRGGVRSLVAYGNASSITGGSGNCCFLNLAMARGDIWENFLIRGNVHRASGRADVTVYNAFIRANATSFDISGVLVEGNIVDHMLDPATTYGAYLQGSAATGKRLTDFVMRNNQWPSAANLLYSDNFPVSYLVDEVIEIETTDATPQNIFNARMSTQAVAAVELDLMAYDKTSGDAAGYRKQSAFKRGASGNIVRIGAETTYLSVEDDATWDAATGFAGNFLHAMVTGDATNPVVWKGRVKVDVRPA